MEFVGWEEWQIKEWVACKADIIYFVETYVWVFEKETASIIPFNMLPYRQLMLEELEAGRSILVDKCRRAGASWTAETFTAWEANFWPGSSALNLSKREADAFALLDKHRFVLDHLALHDSDNWETATKASWLKGPVETDSKGTFAIAWYNEKGELSQVSESNSLTTTKESGRSEGARTFIFDEFGFVKPDDQATWRAARPSIMRGGKFAMISCVTPDTLIFTSEGVVKIGDYIPDSVAPGQFGEIPELMVYGRYGTKPCTVVYNSGVQDTIKITTKYGYSLECTEIHPILVSRNGVLDWVQSKDIEVGDFIPIERGADTWGNETSLRDCVPEYADDFRYRNGKWVPPQDMTEDLAYLLGLIVGDGYMDKNRVCIATVDDQTINWLVNNGCGLKFSPQANGEHVIASSRPFVQFCQMYGMPFGVKAPCKFIPDRIMRSPKNIVRSFLSGLFDADGCATNRGVVSFVTTSEVMANQVHMLLLNFGIAGSLYFKRSEPTDKVRVRSDQWVIEIGLDAREFFDRIGFRLTRKQERRSIVDSRKRSLKDGIPFAWQLVDRIRSKLPKAKDGSKTKSRRRLSDDIMEKKPSLVSYYSCQRILDWYVEANNPAYQDNYRAYRELEYLVDKNYLWVSVEDIDSGQSQTYDLSIPDGHSFVSNGLISHNTPNGVGGVYYRMCMKARRAKQRGELDKLNFTYIEVDWWDTEITQEMYDALVDEMTEQDIRQEFGREFISSGMPAFDHTLVTAAYKPIEDNPWLLDYFEEYHQRVLDPEDPACYVLAADTAKGRKNSKGNSMNYMTVFTLDGIQVMSEYNKQSIATWAGNLVSRGDGTQVWVSGTTTTIHEKYPGLFIVETNMAGDQIMSYHQIPQDGKSSLVGWETTHQSKGWLVFNTRKAFEGMRIVLTCQHTYEQVINYQDLGGGRYDAPDGDDFYDDPVIGTMLAIEGINQIRPASPDSISGAIVLGNYLPSMTGQLTRDIDIEALPHGPRTVDTIKGMRHVDLVDPGRVMDIPRLGLIDGI